MLGGPPERRRFLDRGAALLRPGHIRSLRDFRRALAQRNRLLGELREREVPQGAAREALRPWDEVLVRGAAPLVEGRADFVRSLAEKVRGVTRRLLPERDKLELAYRPRPGYDSAGGEDYGATLGQRLAGGVAGDLRLGYTVAGPQRDDLALRVEGKDLWTFGSSGQLRATMIALLLAQMELIRERRGAYPVLLLDDVDSDIDEARYARLMESLQGDFQAVVATSKGSLPGVAARRRLLMEAGRARREG
jgi:DNA replication and repair protein RecF